MFKMNKELRKLGVVSVSALMLLGVGAGMSSTHTNVHAENIFDKIDGQIDHNYDVAEFGQQGAKQREKWDAQQLAAGDAKVGVNPYTDSGVTSELSHNQITEIIQRSKNDPAFGIDNNDVVPQAVPKGMTRAEVTAEAESANESNGDSDNTNSQPTSAPVVHHVQASSSKANHVAHHANAVKKPRVHRHHARIAKVNHKKVNRSLKHDTVYVNQVHHKRHARKNVAKRLRNVKRHARRTNKRGKRVNLQREIRSLKKELRKLQNEIRGLKSKNHAHNHKGRTHKAHRVIRRR